MIDNSYEQEIEYERLAQALAGANVGPELVRWHAGRSCPAGRSALTHVQAVAGLSAAYAESYYADAGLYAQRYFTEVCRLAGFLHEAIVCGADFEALAHLADETAARAVAALTPDLRLPQSHRLMLLANQLGLADAPARIVKLADLRCVCASFSSGGGSAGLADWLREAWEVVPILEQAEGEGALRTALLLLKQDLQKLGASKGAIPRRRRRTARVGGNGREER